MDVCARLPAPSPRLDVCARLLAAALRLEVWARLPAVAVRLDVCARLLAVAPRLDLLDRSLTPAVFVRPARLAALALFWRPGRDPASARLATLARSVAPPVRPR